MYGIICPVLCNIYVQTCKSVNVVGQVHSLVLAGPVLVNITKIGTEVAHVTRDSDTTFKFKRSRSQAALLTAALTRQTAAAVSVGTYWSWEPTATLQSAGAVGSAARGASAPTEGGGVGLKLV